MSENVQKFPIGTTAKMKIEDNFQIWEFFPPEKWKPEDGETCYSVSVVREDLFKTISFFNDNSRHIQAYDLGLIFKTEDEAITKSIEIIEFLKSKKSNHD